MRMTTNGKRAISTRVHVVRVVSHWSESARFVVRGLPFGPKTNELRARKWGSSSFVELVVSPIGPRESQHIEVTPLECKRIRGAKNELIARKDPPMALACPFSHDGIWRRMKCVLAQCRNNAAAILRRCRCIIIRFTSNAPIVCVRSVSVHTMSVYTASNATNERFWSSCTLRVS